MERPNVTMTEFAPITWVRATRQRRAEAFLYRTPRGKRLRRLDRRDLVLHEAFHGAGHWDHEDRTVDGTHDS